MIRPVATKYLILRPNAIQCSARAAAKICVKNQQLGSLDLIVAKSTEYTKAHFCASHWRGDRTTIITQNSLSCAEVKQQVVEALALSEALETEYDRDIIGAQTVMLLSLFRSKLG